MSMWRSLIDSLLLQLGNFFCSLASLEYDAFYFRKIFLRLAVNCEEERDI